MGASCLGFFFSFLSSGNRLWPGMGRAVGSVVVLGRPLVVADARLLAVRRPARPREGMQVGKAVVLVDLEDRGQLRATESVLGTGFYFVLLVSRLVLVTNLERAIAAREARPPVFA